MSIRKLVSIAAAVTAISAALPANAALLAGETVGFKYIFPDQSSVFQDMGTAVVGAGVEFTNFSYFNLDVADTAITASSFAFGSSWTSSAFNGFVLTDTNNAVTITSVSVDPLTNMAGLDSSRISFDAHNIYVNWNGLSFDPSTIVKLDINGGGTVPEPTSIALAALGLLGLSISRRRKAVKPA